MNPHRLFLKIVLTIACLSSSILNCAYARHIPVKTDISAGTSPRFQSLHAAKCKFSISMQGKNYGIMGSLKIITDSVIQISITPFLGIEMYRAVLYPDSIVIIDKNNRNYFTAKYEFLQQKFGILICFKDIQSLLSNQPFDESDKAQRPEIQALTDGYSYTTTHNGINTKYSFNDTHQLLQTQLSKSDPKALFTCDYKAFTNYETTSFPSQFTIETVLGEKQAGLSISFDKIIFNSSPSVNAINLSDYNKVGFEQIFPL